MRNEEKPEYGFLEQKKPVYEVKPEVVRRMAQHKVKERDDMDI